MERIQEILLEVWKEVSRHTQVDESVRTIGKMLFDRTSVTSIRLDQASSDANSIETMAIAVVRPGVDRPVAVELSEEAKKCLGQHARNGQLLVGTGPEDFSQIESNYGYRQRFLRFRCNLQTANAMPLAKVNPVAHDLPIGGLAGPS